MNQADSFKHNDNQATQLSKLVALPDDIRTAWESWFDAQGVRNDFMNTRNQPIPQIRDSF